MKKLIHKIKEDIILKFLLKEYLDNSIKILETRKLITTVKFKPQLDKLTKEESELLEISKYLKKKIDERM